MNKQKKVQLDTMGQQNAPQKKKDIKTTLRNLLVLVLVAAVSIVGTLAFLADNSDKKVNTFKGSAGIDVTLTETQWDAKGKNMADSYTPEMKIPKDPTLSNTSTANCEEWVAMRVDYKYNNNTVTKAMLEAVVIETIDMSTDWYKLSTKKDGSASTSTDTDYDIYIYKKPLAKTDSGSETATLFNYIEIKDQTTLEGKTTYNSVDYTVYTGTEYTGFEITVYGAAIKNDASLKSGLDEIGSDIGSYYINMASDDTLDAQIADINSVTSVTAATDSKLIALSLAKLLRTLPS